MHNKKIYNEHPLPADNSDVTTTTTATTTTTTTTTTLE
jgi:hypothetical protein